jgi:hypothetical protein
MANTHLVLLLPLCSPQVLILPVSPLYLPSSFPSFNSLVLIVYFSVPRFAANFSNILSFPSEPIPLLLLLFICVCPPCCTYHTVLRLQFYLSRFCLRLGLLEDKDKLKVSICPLLFGSIIIWLMN